MDTFQESEGKEITLLASYLIRSEKGIDKTYPVDAIQMLQLTNNVRVGHKLNTYQWLNKFSAALLAINTNYTYIKCILHSNKNLLSRFELPKIKPSH